MTSDRIRRLGRVYLWFGLNLVGAMLVLAFVIIPVMDACGWVAHPAPTTVTVEATP